MPWLCFWLHFYFLIGKEISYHVSEILTREPSSVRGSQKKAVHLSSFRDFHVAFDIFPTDLTLCNVFSDRLKLFP